MFVLFKQLPRGQCPADTLFRLYQKGIRNVVLWLEDQTVDSERVRRLCGLGMHMVFFDVVPVAEGADGVMLGRAFLYALGAAGQAGVERCLEIIKNDLLK